MNEGRQWGEASVKALPPFSPAKRVLTALGPRLRDPQHSQLLQRPRADDPARVDALEPECLGQAQRRLLRARVVARDEHHGADARRKVGVGHHVGADAAERLDHARVRCPGLDPLSGGGVHDEPEVGEGERVGGVEDHLPREVERADQRLGGLPRRRQHDHVRLGDGVGGEGGRRLGAGTSDEGAHVVAVGLSRPVDDGVTDGGEPRAERGADAPGAEDGEGHGKQVRASGGVSPTRSPS